MNSNKIANLLNLYKSIGINYIIEELTLKDILENPNILKNENRILDYKTANKEKPDVKLSPKSLLVKNTNIDLSHISSLVELKHELENFNGCSLKSTALNTVFGIGSENANIVVIGEAPGADEDEKGEPFVGRSGKLLTSALASIGLTRDNIFITNTVFWRPPGNRNPTDEETMLCYPFIKKMLELINPKIIILVGKVAAHSFIKSEEPIGKMRGKWHDICIDNSNYIARVVFHPSYLLRNSTQKKALWLDLLEIKDRIHSIVI